MAEKVPRRTRQPSGFASLGRRVFSIFTLAFLAALGSLTAPRAEEARAPAQPEFLRIAVDPNRPPYQFWSDGRLTGFNVELISRIGVLQGVEIVLFPMGRESCDEALSSGRVDAILGCPFSPARADLSDFSEPLAASSIGVLVSKDGDLFRRGLSNLTDGVLALTRNSHAYDFLKNIRVIRFNETAVPRDAFELLVQGRADALLEDRMTILYLLRERPDAGRFKFAASYWLPVEYTVAVSKERSYLLYLINAGIREMKNTGVYSALFERWFREEEYETRRRLRRLLSGFIAVLLASSLFGGLGVWWTRQLSSRVRARTQDLHRANDELTRQMYETEDKTEFINQILESSPRGLVTCDTEGVVTVCNTRAREIGRLESDPIGLGYGSYPFLKQFLDGKVEPILSQGRQYLFDTEEWARPEGTVLHIRYSLYPLRNHDQDIEGVIFSFEDFTGQKAMQDRIFEREKNRALGRLVASIAHEIRNPLTSIKTFVELLPSKAGNPQFLKEMTNYVPKEVERVDDLIRNLIDFSKPRAASRAREDMGSILCSCEVLLAPLVTKRGFRLRAEAEEGLYASVDRDQIKQCVLNFVLNSAYALEELRSSPEAPQGVVDRSEILMAARRRGAFIRVEVRDRGGGMTEEEALRAMEPFYTTKPKGVGLGLPLSRQYVEENKGTLSVESVKGEGTAMIMEFPGERG